MFGGSDRAGRSRAALAALGLQERFGVGRALHATGNLLETGGYPLFFMLGIHTSYFSYGATIPQAKGARKQYFPPWRLIGEFQRRPLKTQGGAICAAP
jgi:hypothetical protein